MEAGVFRVPMKSPDDISGVVELLESGQCHAQDMAPSVLILKIGGI